MNQEQAAAELIRSIEKVFGHGTLMAAEGSPPDIAFDVLPTGSFAVDRALGVGGLPKGRIVEIYGPEASGKTTMALSVVAQAQKRGSVAAFIDAEHALDLRYARKLGIDCSKMLLSQPDCGEQAMDIVEALVRSGQVDVVVVDSVAALVPKAEIDGEAGSEATGSEGHAGLQARLMSRAMRKLASLAHQTGTTIIFVNKVKLKEGMFGPVPDWQTQGDSLKFYASVRLDVRRVGMIKHDGKPVGQRVKIKVAKNKMAPPFRQAEVDLCFSTAAGHALGFCREAEIFDIALAQEVVARSGAFYRFAEELVGQGRARAVAELQARPELCARIEAALLPDDGECGQE